ncbi:MAG TPA: membrane dipeptidase [Trueperaceae bacterium]|nr:membrane dipeptidase [Trueperaceae bacterium]
MAGYPHTTLDDVLPHPLQKGHHTPGTTPYIFIDSCVQIWEDTEYGKLSDYSADAYCITTFRPHDDAGNALDAIADWYKIERSYPNIRIVRTAQDIIDAKANGQTAIIINSQGGDFLCSNMERLDVFQAMGLRMMLPAYNNRNAICDGCLEPTDAGLSTMGREWVAGCNRLGIVMDLTHVGARATFEVMELTTQPVVFSHSNPTGLVKNARNVTDEQIKACAATGGVVAPTNWGPLNLKAGSTTRPTVNDYLDAVDYIVDLVGIDHVGIGTDMSHGTYPDGDKIRGLPSKRSVGGAYADHIERAPRSRLRYVEGFDDYGQLPTVVELMKKRGYSEEDVGKVLGGNYLRVFRAVWGA